MVDELIEEGLVKRWSVSEVLGALLPRVGERARRARARSSRPTARTSRIHLFTWSGDGGKPLVIPEQGRRLRAHERGEARARRSSTARSAIVVAQHLDVAGAWFGRAGLVAPPDADDVAPRSDALDAVCEVLDNYLFTHPRDAREAPRDDAPRQRAPASRARRGREAGRRGPRRGHPDGAHGPRLRRRRERGEDAPRADVRRRRARGRHARRAGADARAAPRAGPRVPRRREHDAPRAARREGAAGRGAHQRHHEERRRRQGRRHVEERRRSTPTTASSSRVRRLHPPARRRLQQGVALARARVPPRRRRAPPPERRLRAPLPRAARGDGRDPLRRHRRLHALSETILKTPAKVAELVETWSRDAVDIVWQHGGVFDKMVGDCVIALFGPPFYDETPGERLARAHPLRGRHPRDDEQAARARRVRGRSAKAGSPSRPA